MRDKSSKTRLLVVTSAWPHVAGSFEAANVVIHALVSELLRSGNYDISYAYINSAATPIPKEAQPEIDALKQAGVTFLPPLLIPPPELLRRRPLAILKALFAPETILFGYGARTTLAAHTGHAFDAVLTIWSEVGLNAACDFPAKRFAYHGNPDNKVFDAQHEAMRLAGAQPKGIKALAGGLRRAVLRFCIERAHLAVLRRYDAVADVAANDAAYYARHGVNASYIPNTWPMLPPPDWEARRDALEVPGKITGNVGNLSATGNSLGFIALGQEVLPALKARLDGEPFEIHLFGGREPKPFIKPLLDDPHIRVRGFVDDLNAEILSSPVFLIANNHHRFKVSHTRILHAWSLGACVVAFDGCRDAMPEIEHGKNALLGRTAEDVAALIGQALNDRDLRRRIARGGVEALRSHYAPSLVARRLRERMEARLA